ncbi:MAG: MarR family transcriptional regulator [Acidobacteriota bacterium]|nr:MarR family transcriptional regulator [Acidobacteriota bacterium]
MAPSLRDEIQQKKPFSSLGVEAFLNLQRTSAGLLQAHATFLKAWGLTPTQYNVLRILRGAHPDTLACREVGNRMVTPVPDVTRLLDRLEKRELVRRERHEQDRRVVRVGITKAGLDALAALDEPLNGWVEKYIGHMDDERLAHLVELLEALRSKL